MAKPRLITIAEINISMHAPHSPDGYADLFRKVYRAQRVVSLGKLHGAMIGSMYGQNLRTLPATFTGEIYRFVNIDPSNPWFNTRTQKAATEDDVEEVNIPEHLRPHLQRIPFAFNLKRHRLYFVARDRGNSLGVSTAVTLFRKLFERFTADGTFPTINVTAIPEANSLEDIFAIAHLETLVIDLVRPNPDDGEDDEARFLKKLERQNSRRIRTTLLHESGKSLKPDSDTKSLAKVASANGKVVGIGKDAAGDKVEESTSDRPALHRDRVDENVETTMDVLNRYAS